MAHRGELREATGRPCLQLLSGFDLSVGGRSVALPNHAQRVLAFLAVHDRCFPRQALAERLWLDVTNDRAQASLRTALWRIRKAHARIIASSHSTVHLTSYLRIDLRCFLLVARRILSGEVGQTRLDEAITWCNSDLLPSWDEDWILLERERLRQLRIHTLEALSRLLSAAGKHAQAVDTAYAAVSAEPLRESAQAALIQAHLAEGNYSEAVRQYELFSRCLRSDLGINPSAELRALVRPA